MIQLYSLILCMSSPRERTDREELLKKKKRERERECAPILLRRNRRGRRDLTVSCLKCVCVCVARVNFLKKVKPFVLFQTKGAERAGDIFFPCALLKSDEAKKKISSSFKKSRGTTQRERESTTLSPHFFSLHLSAHTNTNTHTHTRTRTIYPTTTTTS